MLNFGFRYPYAKVHCPSKFWTQKWVCDNIRKKFPTLIKFVSRPTLTWLLMANSRFHELESQTCLHYPRGIWIEKCFVLSILAYTFLNRQLICWIWFSLKNAALSYFFSSVDYWSEHAKRIAKRIIIFIRNFFVDF